MPLMTPEQMYRIGMGLGTAQMQGEQQGISLYGHMMQTQKLQEELNKTRALRELARSIPQSQTYTLSGQTMPQGMTGNEEYVPAETQAQKVEVPYSMSERLSMYGAKAMEIDPIMGSKFVTAAAELQKATDPMEKAARFGKFFNEIRTLPVKAKQALLGSMAQTPEWKKLFGNVDISSAMNTDEGTVVPARDDEGNIIGHHVLSPDGSKWDFRTDKGEKWTDWGYGQKKNTKTGEIINVPTKPEKDTSGEWDRRQGIKEQAQFKKEQKDVLDDYTRDVQKLRGRYDASVRSGIKMTDEDWNSALQEIADQYEPKFKKYNIQWGKPSSKAQQAAGGKDEFGFTPGQTTSKNGVTYKYLGNDKWQKQ
jgi:hypothetical protein